MKAFKGPKRQRGFIQALAGFAASPGGKLLGQGISGLFGGLGGAAANRRLDEGRDDVLGLAGMDGPFNVAGNFGQSRDGTFTMNQDLFGLQNMLSGAGGSLLGGGLFNDPNFQSAFNANDLAGALGQANSAFGAQAGNTAFGGLGGLFNQGAGIQNMLANQIAGGPVDQTGGLMGNLLGAGFANQQAAGDQSALFNQSLDAQRAAFAPQANRQFNQLQDRLFATGNLGSTGGGEQLRGLMEAQNQADLGFQNNAFGQAMQQQQFLGNLGSQQIGQGANFLGQNLGQFNQGVNNFNNMGGFLSGLEGQQFGQNLQGMQFNTSQGMNRLQNAMGLFGQGADVFGQQFGLGLQGAGGALDFGRFGLDAAALPAQLQASLLQGSGNHAGALAGIADSRAQGAGGFLGGIGDAIGGLFG